MFKKIYNFLKRIFNLLFNKIKATRSYKVTMTKVPDYLNGVTDRLEDRLSYTIHKVYIKRRPRSLRSGLRSEKYYQEILLRKRKPSEFSKTVEYVKIPKRKR